MARLTLVNGPLGRTVVELKPAGTVLGRGSDCDVVLNHDWVSRRHCRLVRADAGWQVEDLGSCNGICVNGARVNGRAPLTSADLIALGPLIFMFTGEPATQGPPPAAATAPAAGRGAHAKAHAPAAPTTAAGGTAPSVRVALAPDLRFHVTLAARLLTQREVTQGGKTTLKAIARRGKLAADKKFDGRLSGWFAHTHFMNLDAYPLIGRASYALRAGLLVPRGAKRGQAEWVEAFILYKVEHTVRVGAPSGPGSLDQTTDQVELGSATHTLLDTGAAGDPGATSRLVNWAKSLGRGLPYDVSEPELTATLEESARTCLAADGRDDRQPLTPTDALKLRCLEAAGLYRAWYQRSWGDQVQRHDSQLPIGELDYEFDAQGRPVGRAIAVTLNSVYRWV